jgi:ribosomal protein S18 acetylase RimI-like enzyme
MRTQTSACGNIVLVDFALIEAVEDVAGRAVPATEVLDINGWLARRSPGLATKRANSVLARTHGGGVDLEGKLSAVESFYGEFAVPARYQITPVSRPRALEALLLARGYTTESPTAVRTCALRALVGAPMAPGVSSDITSVPTETWWATWQSSLGLDSIRATAVSALFGRVQQRTAFVTVIMDDMPAGVALGILEDRWLGIFNMTTLPALRRRGAGRTALAALARWGQQHSATTGYLQVDLHNQPAARLYRDAGFIDSYRYAYLSRDPNPLMPPPTSCGHIRRPASGDLRRPDGRLPAPVAQSSGPSR